ncbi:hypothetical protein F2Q69_00012258 [Brassica cretica]|uniref:CCHC-type domain-containing protein n=1 Tax=Brassica cretica TaxID=69181 RepID=A0A8S9QSC6_BRACR|nr:hypothetical protein F2Q69_00012258 [Brassica cretica]
MANRGMGDDGRGRIWGEGMDWTCGGLGYGSDQDDGNGVSEMFGHDRSPLQRTRSSPIYGNRTRVREDSMASISPSHIWHWRHQYDQSVQSNRRADQNRATKRPQDQGAENTLKLLHDAEWKTISHSGGHTKFSQGEWPNFNKGPRSHKGKGRGFGGQANNRGNIGRKYFPPEAKHRLERQFINLVQGDRPVRSYESAFTRLRRHVFDGREDEATMIRNFMYGLKPELGSRLAGSNFSSLLELVEKAVNVETVLDAERKTIQHSGGHTKFSQGEMPNFNKGPRSHKGKGREFGGQANNPGNTGVCYTCDQPGHISRFCPKNQQVYSSIRMEDVTCVSCGMKGHYASSCPNKPIPLTPLAIRAPPSRPAIEPAPKKQNLGGRVYALGLENPDNAGPSSGPITGIGSLTSSF